MGKKQVNFNIDEDLLKQIKLYAVEKGLTQTELFNKYIEDGFRRDTDNKQTKLD